MGTDAQLLEELMQQLLAAEKALVRLAADMAAAGASSASERVDDARAEVQAAAAIGQQLRRRLGHQSGTSTNEP